MLNNRYIIYVILMLYLFNYGCAAFVAGAGAGAAGVIWYKGKLQETVQASVPRVHKAAKSALKDFNIKITEEKYDSLTSEIRGELADGRKIWIDSKSITSSSTKITIRVGVLGDKDFSLRIRDAIKKRL